MVVPAQVSRRLEALRRTDEVLAEIRTCPRHHQIAESAESLRRVVANYLIPRLSSPGSPITVVFAGPTGSGKSTLINSLTRVDLSAAGALRPTTTRPIVLCRSDAAGGYGNLGGVTCEVVAGEAPALQTMTLIDTPDIDSTSREHRMVAERLIDSADVIVFVTSALRYADDVPWQILRRARAREAEVINVLNRVASTSSGAAVDFRSRLDRESFGNELLVVPEYHLAPGVQMLPSVAVRQIARKLNAVTTSREDAAATIRDRVSRSTRDQLHELASTIEQAAEDHDRADAGLVERLRARAGVMEMESLLVGLAPPLPPDSETRRWIRAVRADDEARHGTEEKLNFRLSSEIESRARRSVHVEATERGVQESMVLDGVSDLIDVAVRGWMDVVRGMTVSSRKRHRWPAQLALMSAALGGGGSALLAEIMEHDPDAAIGLARRELEERLEGVFDHLGNRMVELGGPRVTIEQAEALRASIPVPAVAFSDVDA